MSYNDVFRKNLKKLIKERTLMQKDLSGQCGVSPGYLTDILKGRGNPSINIMEAISKALDVPLPLLLLPDMPVDMKSHEFVTLVLAKPRAAKAKQWHKEAITKLNR